MSAEKQGLLPCFFLQKLVYYPHKTTTNEGYT